MIFIGNFYGCFIFSIRGGLASVSLFLRNIGLLFGYTMGAIVEYEYIPYICVVMPIAFVIIFSTLPSTPQHYAKNGEMKVSECVNISILI